MTLIKSLAPAKMLILNQAADTTSSLIAQANNTQADPDSNARMHVLQKGYPARR